MIRAIILAVLLTVTTVPTTVMTGCANAPQTEPQQYVQASRAVESASRVLIDMSRRDKISVDDLERGLLVIKSADAALTEWRRQIDAGTLDTVTESRALMIVESVLAYIAEKQAEATDNTLEGDTE